jgi:hypothetical protein
LGGPDGGSALGRKPIINILSLRRVANSRLCLSTAENQRVL